MTDGPVLYLPSGKPVRLHLVGERGDMEYVGMVDEGVAGYQTATGDDVTVLFMQADDSDDTDGIDSATLVYGEGGDRDD